MTTLGAKIRSRTQRLADQHTREEKNQKIITHFGYQSVPSICLHATSISMTQAAVMTVITVVNGNSIHKCANCEHYFHINSWSLSYNASDEWWVMSDELLHKYSSPGPPSTSHSHRIIAKNLLHPLSCTRVHIISIQCNENPKLNAYNRHRMSRHTTNVYNSFVIHSLSLAGMCDVYFLYALSWRFHVQSQNVCCLQ